MIIKRLLSWISFQRLVQLGVLWIYCCFLASAASWYFLFMLPLDFFLKLDPALMTITALSSRAFSGALIPAIVVLISGIIVGRAFCGYICPMGTTLDGSDKLVKVPYKKQKRPEHLRGAKYLVLIFLVGGSLFSVSFVFLFSPLSLITRLYGLIFQPVFAYLSDGVFKMSLPLIDRLELTSLLFAQIDKPRFATQFFVIAFFVLLVVLARLAPRFWCRYLCPAGAMLALMSRKPLIRRHVSQECSGCRKCASACPMGAIPEENFQATHYEECLLCRTCKKVCPEKVISFLPQLDKEPKESIKGDLLPNRRQLMIAGISGAGAAVVSLSGLHVPYGQASKGRVVSSKLIRPPAARPEMDFLSRCVRCGWCMVACPTNTLQPIWFEAGLIGAFSPVAVLRRGPCIPECHHCSQVCPTGAIRNVSGDDRIWAKIGTAVIHRQECLAWEHHKKCMVCDEVCPFNAVEFVKDPGNPVTVPQVIENKCTGCGYCEHHCPVQNRSAITISPMGELRLAEGSYKKEGQLQGLTIILKTGAGAELPAGYEGTVETAPGFDSEGSESLAPGFDD